MTSWSGQLQTRWLPVAQRNWERAIQNILDWEGGFAERAAEPGGGVNKGVSFLVFQEWRKLKGRPEPTMSDLRALSEDEAREIYRARFANPIDFDNLPPGYDYALLTAAVMTGPTAARRLHEQAKGDIGHLMVLMMHDKMQSKSIGKFARGWGNRLMAVYDLARELANG